MSDFRMRRRSASQSTDDELARATKAFASHEIVSSDARSWVLKKRRKDGDGWDGHFWVEVVVFNGGTMLVHGDIDHVMFGHYGKFEEPAELVYWMGGTKDFSYYVMQKARIGMGNLADKALETRDEGVFFDRILGHIEDRFLDGQRIPDPPEGVEWESYLRAYFTEHDVELDEDGWVAEALWGVLNHDMGKVIHDMEHCGDSELWESGAYDWADVPSTRPIYAYAALKRLVQLLDEKDRLHRVQREESVGDGG